MPRYVFLVLIGLPLAAVLIGVTVNLRDAAPSPELRTVEAGPIRWNRDKGNAYFYLLGFGVAPGRDPVAAARWSVRRYNAQAGGDHHDLSLDELENNLEGLVLEGNREGLCDLQGGSCLAHFERDAGRYDRLVRANALLLERYRALIQHTAYHTPLTPSFLEPYMPTPQLLQQAQQLLFYQVVAGGTVDTRALEQDLAFWRLVLSRTDILVDKMLAVHMTESGIAFRDELLDRYGTRCVPSLSLLTAREADLDGLLWHKLGASLWLVDQMARFSVDFYPDTFESVINSPLGKHFLQPTATKNLVAAFYIQVIDILNDGPRTWSTSLKALERRFEERIGGISRVYNPVGKYSFTADTEHFLRYAARIVDLKGYLVLLMLKHRMRGEELLPDEIRARLEEMPDKLRNPYNGEPMQYDEIERSLYFEPRAGRRERVAASLDGMTARDTGEAVRLPMRNDHQLASACAPTARALR